MWIFSKALEELDNGDLQFLITNRVRESATLEYKAEMYGSSAGAIKEMVRDVVSMANAEGGVIVIGMAEDQEGAAKETRPIPDAEVQARRLISSCLSNVSERISGLRALPIQLDDGSAIVVRIPRSFRRPHMVTFEGANDFWMRHDRQKSRMSVSEVRTAVTMTEDLESKAERFLDSRRRSWEERNQSLFVLTATPLLLEEGRIDIRDATLATLLESPPTLRPGRGASLGGGKRPEPSIRGLRIYQPSIRLLEVYRNGHVEFALWDRDRIAQRFSAQGPWILHGFMIPELLRNFAQLVIELRNVFAIADPYLITLAIYNAANLGLYEGTPNPVFIGIHDPPLWREGLHLTLPATICFVEETSDGIAQRVSDHFWNAFGFMRCPFFDTNGRLVLP